MARKRMIDPSIWSDDGMAELTPRQQLLYIGLFSNADDDGRLKGSTVAIRLMCPTVYYGESDDGEIENDLRAVLAVMRQLVAYEVEGKPYLHFQNYRDWQRIDKPQASKLPEPPVHAENPDTATIPITIPDRSENDLRTVTPNRREEKRSKEKGSEGNIARSRATPTTPTQVSVGPEQPIEYVMALAEEMGQPFDEISPTFKSKQAGFGKKLREQGHAVDQVRRCIRWLKSDEWWVSKGIDLYTVTNQIGKFELAGEPATMNPTKHRNGRAREPDFSGIDEWSERMDAWEQRQ